MAIGRIGLLPAMALAAAAPAAVATGPATIVERQVAMFNKGDLAAFIDCYAEDVEVFAIGPTTIPPLKGREAFRARYAPLFAGERPRVTILSRMVEGQWVVDRERTVGRGRTEQGLAIYQVEAGRIRRVWFTP